MHIAAVRSLPQFIAPMLARPGEPFDSDDYLFEIKWDGTRALAYVDGPGRYRLMNRRRLDIADRYPELSSLDMLPPGTLLDGEIVVMCQGKPDFPSLLKRDESRVAGRAARLARSLPATYVVFDQLYDRFEPTLNLPCHQRRAAAQALVAKLAGDRIVMSEAIIGGGKAYFEQAAAMGLEGVVAKRIDSRYLPGKRSDCWIKIKRQLLVPCSVIGFVPEGTSDFGSLIIAADVRGELTCVGKVGSGFDGGLRARLNKYLWSHLREKPIVPSPVKGKWVEPGLYLTVKCMEWTSGGQLRAPSIGEVHGA